MSFDYENNSKIVWKARCMFFLLVLSIVHETENPSFRGNMHTEVAAKQTGAT